MATSTACHWHSYGQPVRDVAVVDTLFRPPYLLFLRQNFASNPISKGCHWPENTDSVQTS